MGKLLDTVSGLLLSTVVPGRVTEENTIHELQNIDLAMKLHYLNCLYFFEPTTNKNDDACRFDISELKLHMFSLLAEYSHVAGRMRRGEDGRPYVRCNDCGVRIAEARSSRTVEEVVRMSDQSVFDGLVYKMELGPDLGFSPLVAIQFTWFKCGGFSIGLRWAHLLGDAFSASAFINTWARLLSAGPIASVSITGPIHDKTHLLPPLTKQLPFAKRVNPVGDHWVVNPGHTNMKTHNFRVGAKQFSQMRSNACDFGVEFPPFEILSAIVWKSVASIRAIGEQSCVTVCRRNPEFKEYQPLSNSQVIHTVETNFSVAGAEVADLMKLISNANVDEKMVAEMSAMDENWNSDFVIYGANLTLVDLGEMGMHKMELKGQKPVLALCSVDGVGEEGLVLVVPDEEDGGDGRIVTVTLEEAELSELKNELKHKWGIA
ncbi:unnamed protein product [Rhodiola kirilowii]